MEVILLSNSVLGESVYLNQIIDHLGDSGQDLVRFMSSSERIVITDFDVNDVMLEFTVDDDSLVWTLRGDEINYYWRCA